MQRDWKWPFANTDWDLNFILFNTVFNVHLSHVKWLKTFNGRIYFRPVIFVSLQIELSGGSSSRRWFACLVVLNYFLLKFYHSFLSPACYLNFILLWNINFEPSFKYMFWIWTHFHFFFNYCNKLFDLIHVKYIKISN